MLVIVSFFFSSVKFIAILGETIKLGDELNLSVFSNVHSSSLLKGLEGTMLFFLKIGTSCFFAVVVFLILLLSKILVSSFFF